MRSVLRRGAWSGARGSLLGALGAAALAITACGDSDEDADRGQRQLEVAATTSIVADVVGELGGDRVEVSQVVPDGASPHSYALSAREQVDVAESDLLVYFHPSLEAELPIAAAPESFAIAEHVLVEGASSADGADPDGGGPRNDGDGEADPHGANDHVEGDDHAGEGEPAHGEFDPHVWMDPTTLAEALPALADAMAELDPDGAELYARRAREYAAGLRTLDRDLAAIVATIPARNRELVTSHDQFGYFADRYGLEVVGAPFGLAPDAGAAAKDLAELIEAVRRAGVPAVFAQRGDDPQVLRTVAEAAGVEVVGDLLVETLGPEASSYEELMRGLTTTIAEALGGTPSDGN